MDDKLLKLKDYLRTQKTDSLIIVQNDNIIDTYGDISKKLLVHSCRKSFLNALFGVLLKEQTINLGATLSDLGIDDKHGLSQTEKQATILDLLRARSGVYHDAAYETQSMKDRKPPRNSHYPGDFWYYNNWDFNTLGYIFDTFSSESIYEALFSLGKKIGMEDFEVADGSYFYEDDSLYPAYDFKMSARDMAKFGQLYLNNGNWNGEQLIDKEWIRRSTTAYSSTLAMGDDFPYKGYGLLWWQIKIDIDDFGYIALGAGGHFIAVIPSKELVIVHRVDNDDDEVSTNNMNIHELDIIIRMVIDIFD